MKPLKRLSALLVGSAAGLVATESIAAPADVVGRLCAGRPNLSLDRRELAASLLSDILPPHELVPTSNVANPREAYLDRALQIARRPIAELGRERGPTVAAAADRLAMELRGGALRSVATASGLPANATHEVLFDPAVPVSITCAAAAEPPPVSRRRFALRKTVDEIALADDDAISEAGSATIAFTRSRTRDEDAGTRTTTTALNIDAAFGVLLTQSRGGRNPAYLYGEYSRSRSRERIKPAPADPAEQGANDVDSLDIGLVLSNYTIGGGAGVAADVRARVGHIFDFERGSRRIAGNIQIEPQFPGLSLPFCGVGEFSNARTRCRFWAEVEGSHIFRRGTAEFADHAEILALGGVARFELGLPYGVKHGPVASAQWRRLETIAGTGPDISRLELEGGWRWRVGDAAVDLKVSYVRGEERKTFENQDILTLGFGLRF